MHLQNRVTPFGEIVAISQRGMFIGNRGIIHNPTTKTLLTRRWTTKTWLVCSCEYKGRRRSVMAGRSWTELFFLDEAVALSAGHRPCFLCRREAAELFRAAWAAAKGTPLPAAAAIDAVLHRERLKHGRKRTHPIPAPVPTLPDGAVVVAAGSAFCLSSGLAYRWTSAGYDAPIPLHRADGLLTPPSTLMALSAGYRPVLHPSITASSPRSRGETMCLTQTWLRFTTHKKGCASGMSNVDPILAAIEQHKEARAAYLAAMDVPGEDREIRAAEDAFQRAEHDAFYELFATAPTTSAGMAALFEHLASARWEGDGDSIIQSVAEDWES